MSICKTSPVYSALRILVKCVKGINVAYLENISETESTLYVQRVFGRTLPEGLADYISDSEIHKINIVCIPNVCCIPSSAVVEDITEELHAIYEELISGYLKVESIRDSINTADDVCLQLVLLSSYADECKDMEKDLADVLREFARTFTKYGKAAAWEYYSYLYQFLIDIREYCEEHAITILL